MDKSKIKIKRALIVGLCFGFGPLIIPLLRSVPVSRLIVAILVFRDLFDAGLPKTRKEFNVFMLNIAVGVFCLVAIHYMQKYVTEPLFAPLNKFIESKRVTGLHTPAGLL